MSMMNLAIFLLLACAAAGALLLVRQEHGRRATGLCLNTALLASGMTVSVALAAHLAARLLWVEEGSVGLAQLGPEWFAVAGFFPAFMVGLVLYPGLSHLRGSIPATVAMIGGVLLATSVAALSVVASQTVIDLRPDLSRPAFLASLLLAQGLLVAAPALGFATLAWDLKARSAED